MRGREQRPPTNPCFAARTAPTSERRKESRPLCGRSAPQRLTRIFFASEPRAKNVSTALKQNNNEILPFRSYEGVYRSAREINGNVRDENRTVARACLAAVLGLAFAQPAPARTQQELMKVCADEWNSSEGGEQDRRQGLSGLRQGLSGEAQGRGAAQPDSAATTAEPAATTGRTNLNTATAAELDRLPQVDEARAKAIIAARAKARFKSWEDFVARKVVPSESRDRHQGARRLLIAIAWQR